MVKRKFHKINLCPHSGEILSSKRKGQWKRWFFPTIGLLALAWFLLRVIPKPSRAAYPCQRVAFPLASGFVVYLIGAAGWLFGLRKAKEYLRKSSGVLAGLCMFFALICLALPFSLHLDKILAHVPPVANSPLGEAKGINPGRVVWVHDPEATSWDGVNGFWWEDINTNQAVVDDMMSKTLQWLTGAQTDGSAWDALFKHFNKTHGKGEVGYLTGEKVVVKINLNNKYINDGYAQEENNIDASPHMVLSLLRQLINQAGVDQSLISVYDAKRLIPDNIYYKCTAEFPNITFMDQVGREGRVQRQMIENSIQFSDGTLSSESLPSIVLEADYMINMAILKRHGSVAAVTLCAKNHFGSLVYPGGLHEKTMAWNFDFDTYDPKVDLMGHKDLGGKTMLFIIDGLYSGANASAGKPTRWQMSPFNDDWPSSILASQDGVAIDSVGYDFLRENWILKDHGDRYLHEAALAGNPPSGTVYDPEGDGIPLSSLGVHEHWNNAIDKQYSRNLGTDDGIELITRQPSNSCDVDKKTMSMEVIWLLLL
jgi:hypothetical protein